MAFRRISATELAGNRPGYLDRAAYVGETIVVHHRGRAVAELRPFPRGIRGAEFLARYRWFPGLTPEEAESLGEDIARFRSELASLPSD